MTRGCSVVNEIRGDPEPATNGPEPVASRRRKQGGRKVPAARICQKGVNRDRSRHYGDSRAGHISPAVAMDAAASWFNATLTPAHDVLLTESSPARGRSSAFGCTVPHPKVDCGDERTTRFLPPDRRPPIDRCGVLPSSRVERPRAGNPPLSLPGEPGCGPVRPPLLPGRGSGAATLRRRPGERPPAPTRRARDRRRR